MRISVGKMRVSRGNNWTTDVSRHNAQRSTPRIRVNGLDEEVKETEPGASQRPRLAGADTCADT